MFVLFQKLFKKNITINGLFLSTSHLFAKYMIVLDVEGDRQI